MLHARRKRLQELTEAEARGETFWTREFDPVVRRRLWSAVEDAKADHSGLVAFLAVRVDRLLLSELGSGIGDRKDLASKFRFRTDDAMMPSLIEAIIECLPPEYREIVCVGMNEVLNEHRITYELVNGQMVEFESKELHQEVVAPALRLLSGRSGWDEVETAYQNALREISTGDPSDAITDAATALQEALMYLGCQGKSLGPLISSARNNGLLAPHDSKLVDGIEKIADWVSADRSTKGDSHKASTGATRDDAWFTVHVVGALLLRLAGEPRTA